MFVKADRIKEQVYKLCSFDRNADNPQGLHDCANYIKSQITNPNAHITEQIFQIDSNIYRNLKVTFGDNPIKTVLGAHYDAYGESPGADDNASSCALLIELCNILSYQDVEVVFFALEEPPIFGSINMGSYIYANSKGVIQAKAPFKPVDIKYMINFEMLGYYTDYNSVIDVAVYNSPTLHGYTIDLLGKDKNFIVGDTTTIMSYRDNADHMWFLENGIATMIVSKSKPFMNKNYHTRKDSPETLNYEMMEITYNKIIGFVLDLLERE